MYKTKNPVISITDYAEVDSLLTKGWEAFLESKDAPVLDPIRKEIRLSWERCKKNIIPPDLRQAPFVLSDYKLKLNKEKNATFLSIAHPVIQSLSEKFSVEGLIFVLSNNEGTILETRATSNTLKKFDKLNFIEGANWSEKYCGTNAIGTSVLTDSALTIFSAEHFCQGWHHLVCTAAPIHDPFTHKQLGVIDITGRKELLYGHNSPLVYIAKQMIEQAIEKHLIEKNTEANYLALLENKKPVIIFTPNGRISRFNRLAQIMFNIKEGSDFVRKFKLPGGSNLQKNFKVYLPYTSHEDRDWEINITPHTIDNNLLGGIAIFSPVNNQTFLGKRTKDDKLLPVARSASLIKVLQNAKEAAAFKFPVLITGSTGTGKEMIAQYIYNNSTRSAYPFIPINCGAIPKDLIASELFGYMPGAFTGANPKGKNGKFVEADKGILFLDEIAELPLNIQTYLLRVLEEKKVYPLGSVKPISIDVRIIAATHKDLEQEIKKGYFREDLYYRLNVIKLSLKDLCDRLEDLMPLFNHFLHQNVEYSILTSATAHEKLLQYPWPGNIRELKNTAEFVVYKLKGGFQIEIEHLPEQIANYNNKEDHENLNSLTFAHLASKQQIILIKSILKQTNGNLTKAAKILKVSRMTLYRKLKKEGIKA